MHVRVKATQGSGGESRFSETVEGTATYRMWREAGDTGALAVRTFNVAVRPPYSWFADGIDQTAIVFRRCAIPLILAMTIFILGIEIIVFGNLLVDLGVADRHPGGGAIGLLRESTTWVTMMIVAGVGASAVTADLAARKVREELDALDVLGVDRIRTLVVPRVLALTYAAVILNMIGYLAAIGINYAAGPTLLHFPSGIYGEGVRTALLSVDVYASIVKHIVMGAFVGVVACQRGLSCKTGAEGVGRAVNETVVITFFGIWLINSFFNLGFLTLFPDASVFRG